MCAAVLLDRRGPADMAVAITVCCMRTQHVGCNVCHTVTLCVTRQCCYAWHKTVSVLLLNTTVCQSHILLHTPVSGADGGWLSLATCRLKVGRAGVHWLSSLGCLHSAGCGLTCSESRAGSRMTCSHWQTGSVTCVSALLGLG